MKKLVMFLMLNLFLLNVSFATVEGLWVLNPETNTFKLIGGENNDQVLNDKLDEEVGVPNEHQECDKNNLRRSLTNDGGTLMYGCTRV